MLNYGGGDDDIGDGASDVRDELNAGTAVSEAGLDSKTGPTIAEVGSKFEAGPDVVGDEYNVGTVASETGLDRDGPNDSEGGLNV